MTAMISEMYDALLSAGAPEEKARKAAEAVASYDQRVGKVEQDLTTKTSDLRSEIVALRADLTAFRTETNAKFTLLQWMVGVVVTGVAALVARSFFG